MADTYLVMPRPDRFTPAGVPVHVTQRGNFRHPVFSAEYDYRLMLELLERYSVDYGNRVIGYCLLSNHFHLVVIPDRDDGVSKMMMALTSKFARTLNERSQRQGHVWQGRFGSASMSENHYRTALAYVDLNPVGAGITRDATMYRWSSAAAHAGLCAYPSFLDVLEFSRMYTALDWAEILGAKLREEHVEELRKATRVGTVSGEPEFVKKMETMYGRVFERKAPGRPRKRKAAAAD